jgi:hypothetical protein
MRPRTFALATLALTLTTSLAGVARAEEAATAAVPAWVSAVTPKADFRFRHEIIDGEGMTLRNRERIRARVGVVVALPPDVDLVVGLASGNDGDPVSTNQTLGGAFSKKPVWLDLAYADWHPSWAPGLRLVLGHMKNPFYAPAKSELVWDTDLNFEGAALAWSRAFGGLEPFVATTLSILDEREKSKDALLLGAQAGLRGTFLDGRLWFTAGGSYDDYTNTRGATAYFDATKGYGNSVADADPDDKSNPVTYVNDYNLVEGFVEVGGKILGFPVATVAHVVKNLDPDDDGLGWLVGAVMGKATKQAWSYELRYSYRVVQKDAVLGAFTESDFRGGGADGEGHKASLELVLGPHASVGATYYFNQKGVDGGTDYHRAQIDVAFKL